MLATLLASASWAVSPENDPTQAPAQGPLPPPAEPPKGLARWFNPATAPFIPVPEIAVDPDSGTTLGIIPTWVHVDENHQVTRIIAPDIIYNPYFGWGTHGRVYGYTSGDEQWSVVAGIKERVEREFDAEYQRGRLREERWSFSLSVIYDRDGTPRFYGFGNESRKSDEANYTNEQERLEMQVGLNLTHAWQLRYTGRLQSVDVQPGTLDKVPTIDTQYLGTDKFWLNRLSIVYDTRDDLTVPSKGVELIAYGGLASRNGVLNDSMFSEYGADGRFFKPVWTDTTLVAHVAAHFMPAANAVPFWALSNIGGGDSEVGGAQPLRGYGAGRFYDRDSLSGSVELRHKVFSFDASTQVDVEVSPFVDVGRVFAGGWTFSPDQLHYVGGIGFRGIARPFVVGYVDIGYGSEGVAAFTGLNYPF
jgi:hypothetical protein